MKIYWLTEGHDEAVYEIKHGRKGDISLNYHQTSVKFKSNYKCSLCS